MALRFYNTLSRELEEFQPLEPGHVRVYACGPTVYRPPHIGNFRTFVFNDVLHRYLEWKGLQVRFVMNLTDVEDKIIDGAHARGGPIGEITTPVIDAFFQDLGRLGIRPADDYPRATEHIAQMTDLIAALLERGHAYVADGSVYFDISSFPTYGRLSRLDLAEIRSGAGLASRAGGIDADDYAKADARDFALWKGARDVDRQAGAVWPTPWGEGRPGWHIECSAMSMARLGNTFDIHTGGEDLVFPHHEDEIAQSEAATGQPFVRYWLHVKHLMVNGEKMSKSKGNDFTIQQLSEQGHPYSAIRYLLLQAHYRRDLNFTLEGLEDARAALRRLLDFRQRLTDAPAAPAPVSTDLADTAARGRAAFEEAMDDDLNTPNALRALFDFVREANGVLDRDPTADPAGLEAARNAVQGMDDVLGVIDLAAAEAATVDDDLASWVEERIAERQAARGRRDFAAADAIRDELTAAGVIVEDTPQGPRWKRS